MTRKTRASEWFQNLRDQLCASFEAIEKEYAVKNNLEASKFARKKWSRDGGGGGEISLMRGNVFEKIGVNISTVYGNFTEIMQKQVPGADEDPSFFATGISLVSHPYSPLIPAAHFNTRYIVTQKDWFGGGADLTPLYPDLDETKLFHDTLEEACHLHDPEYHPKFKKWCDDYFFLPHRNEPRGVGGIFYDYLTTQFDKDFVFTQDVGKAFLKVYPELVKAKVNRSWTSEQREALLFKRGRYVEFNLLHDRGTKFGLMTGGNVEAILMSMPPEVKW